MSFVHLHVHDQYSFLDGFGSATEYAKRAKELGMTAIALTNHGNVDGCIKWQQACQKNGIKSILGVEAYIVPDLATKEKGEKRYHITLLAKDSNGWQNILKMLTYANLDGFYYKPRIDPGLLLEYSNGIVVMSACLASFIYMDSGVELLGELIRKGVDVALEVMPHLIAGQPEHNKLCARWAAEFDIPLVATNDCHYITKEQSDEQEVLLAMQSKAKWNDKNRWKFDINTLFLTTEEEIRKMFVSQGVLNDKDIDTAISNTKMIADKCSLFIEKKEVKLPKPPIPGYKGLGEEDQLIQLTLDGFEVRKEKHSWITDGNGQQYLDRIAEELETIITQGFARYFLIVWELINWCKDPDDGEEPIMCGPGRGSVGGSIVAFCLHIIQVDAIKYDLVFSRFISEGRIDLPDIDMDFEDTKRDRILAHLKKLYGEHNVIGLSTFAQMHGRGALRDVARVFNIPLADVNKAAKSIVTRSLGDSRANFSILDAFEAFEDGKAFYEKYPKVSKMAMAMEGQVKGYGRHAAAMCVAADDLRTGINAHLALRKGTIVANWEKEDAEYMGLMKLDVLGLNALTILNEARKLIKKRHDVDVDYDTLSLDDPAICKEFDAGRGVGVFQFNSPGMMRVCREVRVEDFEELIALNALHRPGPLRSGLITTYRKRKHGEEKVTYIHPFIKKITEKTQGIILYQEQVMMLMYKVGGLPWKTTDMIRKVVSKRKGQEQFLKFKKLFVEGCIKNKTVSAKEGEAIFEELQFFGSYGFVRAHSTEYAMIAYWEMWLKVYYPVEYMTTILTYGSEDKKAEHIREARRLGLKILLPDINASDATRWTIDSDNNLSTPFKEIKGVGEIAATEITKQRTDSPYRDIDDLRSRTQKRKVNTRVVALLDKTHCFDSAQAKLALDDAELDGLSQYFDFELSNDPIYRYRKMVELLQTCVNIEPISDIEFSGKAIGKMRYHFGKMSILKFGYKEHGDGKSLRDVRGTAGDLGGVYGNFEDGSDFTMLVFGSDFYEKNKYAIEHCENEWMLVKAKSTRSDNSVHTSQLWFADDLLKGETEGLKLELLKRPEYSKSYTESISELSECTSCELREECDGPVIPSIGEANVMLLGEAPGYNENKHNRGFYEKAKSGELLWDDLRKYGLERSMFHITNAVKCFPASTKTPKKKHIKACRKWLDIEIEAVKPFIILAFGNTSVKLFTDKESGIFSMSGDTEWNDRYKCFICWCAHPASAIYQQENKVFFDRGIENFVNKLNSLGLGG